MQTGALRLDDVLTENLQQLLVARAQTGDAAAFHQLYEENVGRVFAVCVRIVADRGHYIGARCRIAQYGV